MFVLITLTCVSAADNQTDEILTDENKATFTDLNGEIAGKDTYELTKNYTYNSGTDSNYKNGIEITKDNFVLDGKGYTLDGANQARIFNIKAENVTLKNINFINGNMPKGGAVSFDHKGNLLNCNFTNNTATHYEGGAVHFEEGGNVANSNFVNNTAFQWGGAVNSRGDGTVTNCNFTNNKIVMSGMAGGGAVCISYNGELTYCNFINNSASGKGGAIYMGSGSVENCNFADNSASENGGAILSRDYLGVTVDTCIFKTSSDTTFNTRNLPPTLDVDNFTTIYNSGEKLTLDLKTNRGTPVNNGIILISIYNKNNNNWLGNYTCLSGEEWFVDLPVGSYYAIFNTEYNEFKSVNRTITLIPETAFWVLNYTINSNNDSVINLNNDFYLDSEFDADFADGVGINRPVTINGNGHTINANGKARIFLVASGNVVLENITFINGYITYNGGAVFFNQTGNLTNCNFVNNSASTEGGAVFFSNGGNVSDCSFIGNNAGLGGAISTSGDLFIFDSNFTDNTILGGFNNVVLTGNAQLIVNNVIPEGLGSTQKGYMEVINLTNITYGDSVKITVKVNDDNSNPVNNGVVSVTINGVDYSDYVVNGTATIMIPGLDAGYYDVNVCYWGKYVVSARSVNFSVAARDAVIFASAKSFVINYGGKYSVVLKDVDGRFIAGEKVTFVLNGRNIGSVVSNVKGVASIVLSSDILKVVKAGSKKLVVKFINSNYNFASKSVKLSVNKEKVKIVAKKRSFGRFKKVKLYGVVLKDSKGKAVKGVKLTLKINGKTFKAKSNSKGKVVFKIKKLSKRGTFNAKIYFKATAIYLKSTKNIKIKVK